MLFANSRPVGRVLGFPTFVLHSDCDGEWSVAATEVELADAERHLGHRLDARYRAFLGCANGWRAFYQSVDLFGTRDLIGGPRMQNAEFMFNSLSDAALATSRVSRGELLSIGATSIDRDLFVIVRPTSTIAGTVIWYAGEEVDRFPTFDDFFLAMLEYNRQELQDFKNEKSQA